MNRARGARLLAAVIGVLVLAAVACSDDTDTGDNLSFEHGGLSRSYQFYKPQDLSANSPLIVVLHGRGQASDASYSLGFNPLADKHGFAVAYPQATTVDDPAFGEITAWNTANDDLVFKGVDDVNFLSTLAKHLQTEHNLNPDKTFVTGFSLGGYMSYTLACLASDVFKAAAPVAALMDAELYKQCKPATPMPILHIHGTADWYVPIGGNPKDGSPSVVEIVDLWVKLNGCSADGTAAISKNTTAHYYRNGIGGNEVHYYEITGHEHLWPGQPAGKKGLDDNSGIDATSVIREFFGNY